MSPGLATPLLAVALAVFRPLDAPRRAPALPLAAATAACDDGTDGGSLVQRSDTWYGNRFAMACPAGLLTGVEFAYYGAGLAGPYAYRLHVLDGACREIASTAVRTLPAAPDTPALAQVDVTDLNICVGSAFSILLEPLSCADGAAAHDCMPAVLVDGTSDTDEAAHCGMVNTDTLDGRRCLVPRSADGRCYDFRLRAQVECGTAGCTSATVATDWARVKRLYR